MMYGNLVLWDCVSEDVVNVGGIKYWVKVISFLWWWNKVYIDRWFFVVCIYLICWLLCSCMVMILLLLYFIILKFNEFVDIFMFGIVIIVLIFKLNDGLFSMWKGMCIFIGFMGRLVVFGLKVIMNLMFLLFGLLGRLCIWFSFILNLLFDKVVFLGVNDVGKWLLLVIWIMWEWIVL